jgi:hypothetical protein
MDGLQVFSHTYRPDIRDHAALEKNFRAKFETLNRVALTDAEFQRLLEATALNYFAYNFIKIHRTLRMSPAMAAGSRIDCGVSRTWLPSGKLTNSGGPKGRRK